MNDTSNNSRKSSFSRNEINWKDISNVAELKPKKMNNKKINNKLI